MQPGREPRACVGRLERGLVGKLRAGPEILIELAAHAALEDALGGARVPRLAVVAHHGHEVGALLRRAVVVRKGAYARAEQRLLGVGAGR